MKGCKHNLERIIQYPKMKFISGLYILLICPHGCEPVAVTMKEMHRETRKRANNRIAI